MEPEHTQPPEAQVADSKPIFIKPAKPVNQMTDEEREELAAEIVRLVSARKRPK